MDLLNDCANSEATLQSSCHHVAMAGSEEAQEVDEREALLEEQEAGADEEGEGEDLMASSDDEEEEGLDEFEKDNFLVDEEEEGKGGLMWFFSCRKMY